MNGRRLRSRKPADGAEPERVPKIAGVTGLARLASGANATVYRGDELAMHRKVAVKVMRAPIGDASVRQAFEGECARAGQLGEHPAIATIYRSGFDADRPYIVMQYYAGGSLASKLKAGYRFPVGEVLLVGTRIAAALQYAHDLGILHRDLKPENILSDAFGDTVLTDFGIAIDRDAADYGLRHQMTAAYAAPEVVRHGGGWPVSDVWSLAATLYALLAGRPPFYDFPQPDAAANLRALTGPLPPIGRADVPDHVLATLTRALIGEPDHRTASARRLHDDLRDDLARLGLPPPPSGLDPAQPQMQAPPAYLAASPAPVAAPHASPAHPAAAPAPAYLSADTGYLPTGEAYRIARPATPAPARPWPAWRTAAITVGGGLVVIVLGLSVYAFVALRHPAKTAAGGGNGNQKPSASAAARPPSPPTGVKATVLTGSSVMISWKDAAPQGSFRRVVISLGSGQRTLVVPDRSPQVVRGLNPTDPYCFAVGYVYSLQGAVSYSAHPACIRGGVPTG